ncbi:MAG TPA: serine/threonine-protein kinase [Polyangia bacterium]|jgi:serine/threonine-protein kinase|nr:serine/threonine-protein kinase [Polyangia bacterium]
MIGQSFGNYRAISVLGEGGMGVVYLAEHPEIGRKVAVKVLHPDFARDQQVLGRFLNEARAANAIRHPNIIEILDSGVLPDQTPFLVMELLEGESLAARIRRLGRLPIADICDFAYQAASALNAAHAKGIVHRDLKPDNLFIVPDPHDDGRERLKVLDFGIAKLQQHSPGDSVKTRTGTLMGTPIYMSPEQCRGVRTVDHRSDVYSLGVILYEMALGHPPFVSEGFGDLVNMHMNVPPAPPRRLRPELPVGLESVILTMLAKAPEERFESMAALQTALRDAGEGLFTVRGSSPDLTATANANANANARRTRRAAAPAPSPFTNKATTLTDGGVGEQVPHVRPRRGMVLLGIGVAALAGVAVFVLRGRGQQGLDGARADNPALSGKPGPHPTPAAVVPAPTMAPAPPAAPAMVTIVVESTPTGAKVVGTGDGQLLGETPLTLTRPARAPDLKLRIEKDGYVAISRAVSLLRDGTLAVTLERKPRPAPRPHRPVIDEPARL